MPRVGDDTGGSQEELEAKLQEANRQIETLRQALSSRAVIDQAKGVVMALYRIDADAAFARLAEVSQVANVKVNRLATTLVELVAQRPVDDEAAEAVVRRRLLAPATARSRRDLPSAPAASEPQVERG